MDCCENILQKEKVDNTHTSEISDREAAGSHNCGAPGMSHSSAAGYLRRFWTVTLLLVPLALTNQQLAQSLGIPTFVLGPWIQFGVATVIFGFAAVFFKHAWHEIRTRAFGMMTLVSVAVVAGYSFSVATAFAPYLGMPFYLEISTLIWVLLFGHYLEALSSGAAGNALNEVAKLLPQKARLLADGSEKDVDVSKLAEGDEVIVKPGEKIPADGTVINGRSSVNESLVSGESAPIEKREKDQVSAGSIALDGVLTIRLTRVGEHSTVGIIKSLIKSAQATKPRQARIADKAAAVLTFAALGTSVVAFVVWTQVFGVSFSFAITLAITVLVIACPHALGLAIPTVTTIATSLSARHGAFLKDLAKIETIRKADCVVFDKTGTLTHGTFGVTGINSYGRQPEIEILKIAASLDAGSSHVVGRAIVDDAKKRGIQLAPTTDFIHIAGKGAKARLDDGKTYLVGNRALMADANIGFPETSGSIPDISNVVFVADEDKSEIIGVIMLSDKIKSESKEAVKKLHELGFSVAMLTGDRKATAEAVAREIGIDTTLAEVLPERKYAEIERLQKNGRVVLMVGDGVNDAPALAAADVGIAIGAGTDLAIEAGDVILTRSDPRDVAKLVMLCRSVYRKMVQNLWWALGYNVIAIPAAAGIFAPLEFFLSPEIGAVLMTGSTIIVVLNALTLRRLNLA